MAGGGKKLMLVVVAVVLASHQGNWAAGADQVHHVVGGDRGWDLATDLVSWASARNFNVGDRIWFMYSLAEGTILELESREEYESCDLTNPIRMYTDGLDSTTLEEVGIRYFASSNIKNCKGGLKLHVEVAHGTPSHPRDDADVDVADLALGPTPSASFLLHGADWALLVAALLTIFVGF